MVFLTLRMFALSCVLDCLVHGLPIAETRLDQHQSDMVMRRLQETSGVTGCRWEDDGCTARPLYYVNTAAFIEIRSLRDKLFTCYDSSLCEAESCKQEQVGEMEVCVNQESTMTTEAFEDLQEYEAFLEQCPLGKVLQQTSTEPCQDRWDNLVQGIGCQSCIKDVDFFKEELSAICATLEDETLCESEKGTKLVGQAVCSRTVGAAAETDPGVKIACEDANASEEDGGLSTAAIASIAISAILATIVIAALIAWVIVRSPGSRMSKKRSAAAGAVPRGPGADPVAHPRSPFGAAGVAPDQHIMQHAYGTGQQHVHVNMGPPVAAGVAGGQPRMVPTDVYPSAEQFMASGQGVHPQAGLATDGSFYGSAVAASEYGDGRVYSGSEAQPPAQQRSWPPDIAQLPARDVLVKQIARSGNPAEIFSISTRAAWDATAAGTMPSPTTMGSSKPEEMLEAQLDYVVHQLSGTLLEDSRVGAWVVAPGLQQRISSQSAVVFVHGHSEADSATAPAAGGQQLRALKFYFLHKDFERNVVATQTPELKELMPEVKRIEGDPLQLTMSSLPPPLNVHALPPLIINVRGETLDDHVTRTQPNFVAALSIMIQLAQVVERLHSVGWVHRDLKPSNLLFLAQPARWSLIDWACAAKAGSMADVSFSLYYAPPETVQAYKTGQRLMHAHPSADIWSLGVTAWELFTGRKFYGPAPDLQYVMKVLAGEHPLPTETNLHPDICRRLGNSMFRAAFLSMLHRDPLQRPSARQLLNTWESFFSQTRPN